MATNSAFRERIRLGDDNATWTLDGADVQMQIRTPPPDMVVVKSASIGSGEISVHDAATRVIEFQISSGSMSALPPGEYVYDLLVIISGEARRRLAGPCIIEPGITEAA